MSKPLKKETFGQALRRLRKQRKLTMKRLAERLHVSESYISRLESGERQPSKELILQMGPIFFPEGNTMALDDLLIAADFTPLHLDKFTRHQDVTALFQEALSQNPQNFRAFISLVISLIRQGKIALAEEKINEGFRLFDDQVQLQTLSSALELAKGNYERAIAFQKEALRYFHLSPAKQRLHMELRDLLLNLGVIYFLQGYQAMDQFFLLSESQQTEEAVKACEAAEQLLNQARLEFEAALKLAPDDIYILDEYARVQFNLAYLKESRGEAVDYSATIAAFKQVVYSSHKEKLSYHDMVESALFLVHAHVKARQFAEAEHNINLIECCLPNYWLVHYLKACFYSLKYSVTQDPLLLDEALKSLTRAAEIDDEHNRTRAEAVLDPDLKNLRNLRPLEFAQLLKLEEKK